MKILHHLVGASNIGFGNWWTYQDIRKVHIGFHADFKDSKYTLNL